MKIQFGALITAMSGSFGGMTFAKNIDSAYIRRNTIQCKPRSLDQAEPKSYFTQAVQGWKNLTDNQRLQWKAAAMRIGNASTAFRYYVTMFLQYSHAGKATVSTPPAMSEFFKVQSADVILTRAFNTFTIEVTPVIPAGNYVMVYGTPPMSVGIARSSKGSRLITVLDSGSAAPYDFFADYLAVFGAIPQVGECCFIYTKGIPSSSTFRFWPGRPKPSGGAQKPDDVGAYNDTVNKPR